MTVHRIAIKKSRSESSGRTRSWIKMRFVSASSPPCVTGVWRTPTSKRTVQGWDRRAGPWLFGTAEGIALRAAWPAQRDEDCCWQASQGEGEQETKRQGNPKVLWKGGKEADYPLFVAFGDRCSQYSRLWRVGSGEHNLSCLGNRRQVFFLDFLED